MGRIRLHSVQPAQMGDVYYFSAIAKHLENQSGVTGSPTGRHREYIRAIKHFGVIDRLSSFKRKTRSGHVYHEEKGTDVWLAATLIESVFSSRCDGAVIVSGDTDFAPAAVVARKKAPVWFAPPPRRVPNPTRRRHHNELRRAATGILTLKSREYAAHQLPDRILDSTGNVVATRPKEYARPKPANTTHP